jgi:hypothetical protein
MASEEIGAATGASDVKCAWGDEKNDDEEVADNGRTANGI